MSRANALPTYTHICMWVYVGIHTYICMPAYMGIYACICVLGVCGQGVDHIHKYMYVYIHHIFMYIYTCRYVSACVCM